MIENSNIIKENTDKFSYIEQNNKKRTFCMVKNQLSKLKKQVTNGWKLFATYITNKR